MDRPWSISRATDWRFLMPPTGEQGLGTVLLAGGTDAIAAAIGQAGPADEVYRERCPTGAANVAVVLRDSDLSPEAVAAMLVPGGVLYWEIARSRWSRLWVTPSAARAALRRAGMTPVEAYWVTSGAVGPSMHLPLSHDGAVRWYFSNHHGPSGRLRRSAGRVLRFLAQGRGRRLEWIVPVFALTARRADPRVDARSYGATALADAEVPTWARPRDARPILLSGGEGPWSRVVLLPFARGADRPAGVIKIARESVYANSLVAEQAVLASTRATTPAPIGLSVPEPLGPVRVLGRSGSAETYRPGASIAVRSTRIHVGQSAQRADLARAADWLIDLHDATASGSVDLGRSGLELGALIDRFARVFGRDLRKDLRFWRSWDGADQSDHQLVPHVLRHRDFGPWNVLVDTDGQVSVIDWEVAGQGPPLIDLIYFVVHWCWLVAATSSRSADIQLLRRLVMGEGSDWYLEAGRSVLARHARRLEFGADLVAALFAWTFVEQALDRHDRLAAIADPGAADPSSNRYVQYVAALAALPDLAGSIAGWLDPARDPLP